MKKIIFIFVTLTLPFMGCFTQEKKYEARAAAAGSSEAIGLSMVAWGLGLGVAIAGICLLIKSSTGSTNH